MRESAEFRFDEEFAHMLFAEDEGKKLGSVRRVELEINDPRYMRVGELQKHLRQSKDISRTIAGEIVVSRKIKELRNLPAEVDIHLPRNHSPSRLIIPHNFPMRKEKAFFDKDSQNFQD